MSSDGLIKWFESKMGSFDWTNTDYDTIVKNLKDIQDKHGSKDRENQIYNAIEGSGKSRKNRKKGVAIATQMQENEILLELVQKTNNKYLDNAQSQLNNATTSTGLTRIYKKVRDENFDNVELIDELYQERLEAFDRQSEKERKELRKELRKRARREFASAQTRDEVEQLDREFVRIAEENDFSLKEINSTFGQAYIDRITELQRED